MLINLFKIKAKTTNDIVLAFYFKSEILLLYRKFVSEKY